MLTRYQVTIVHGESGSVFHVVDTQLPETDQPAILCSYSRREYADTCSQALNNQQVAPWTLSLEDRVFLLWLGIQATEEESESC